MFKVVVDGVTWEARFGVVSQQKVTTALRAVNEHRNGTRDEQALVSLMGDEARAAAQEHLRDRDVRERAMEVRITSMCETLRKHVPPKREAIEAVTFCRLKAYVGDDVRYDETRVAVCALLDHYDEKKGRTLALTRSIDALGQKYESPLRMRLRLEFARTFGYPFRGVVDGVQFDLKARR